MARLRRDEDGRFTQLNRFGYVEKLESSRAAMGEAGVPKWANRWFKKSKLNANR